MEDNNNLNESDLNKNNPTNTEEPKEEKPSIFILLLGIFLIVRGVMRMSEGELGAFGIIMIVVGAVNIIYYIAKRV